MRDVPLVCGEDERDIHFFELFQCHAGTPAKI